MLRLALGTNHEGERDTALAKAAEIAAAAGLDVGAIEPGDSDTGRMTREAVRMARLTYARKRAHSVLRAHFGVFVVSGGGSMTYFGPAVNIEIAKHVEVYLLREAAQGWKLYREKMRLGKRGLMQRRRVWELSFFSAINEALEARPLRNDAAELRAEVERYAHSVVKIVIRTPPKLGNVHAADYFSGRRAGQAVNLSRPVETSGEVFRLIG